jgi:hypothetical protein
MAKIEITKTELVTVRWGFAHINQRTFQANKPKTLAEAVQGVE